MVINNTVEIKELNERAENVEKPEDVVHIIMEYEEILRAKKKGDHFGCVLSRKNFQPL